MLPLRALLVDATEDGKGGRLCEGDTVTLANNTDSMLAKGTIIKIDPLKEHASFLVLMDSGLTAEHQTLFR